MIPTSVCGDRLPSPCFTVGVKPSIFIRISIRSAGGGISPDTSRWIPCRRYRHSVHSSLQGLVATSARGSCSFNEGRSRSANSSSMASWNRWATRCLRGLCQGPSRMELVVSAKRPFGGPERFLNPFPIYAPRRHIQPPLFHRWRWSSPPSNGKAMRRESDQDDDLGSGSNSFFLFLVLSPSRDCPPGFVHISFHFGFLANRNEGKTGAVAVLLDGSQAVANPSQIPRRPRFQTPPTSPPMPGLPRPVV